MRFRLLDPLRWFAPVFQRTWDVSFVRSSSVTMLTARGRASASRLSLLISALALPLCISTAGAQEGSAADEAVYLGAKRPGMDTTEIEQSSILRRDDVAGDVQTTGFGLNCACDFFEGENDCGLPTDTTNGGCNFNPVVTTPISVGDTVCGTAGASNQTRDTDWYEFSLLQMTTIEWEAFAVFAFHLEIVDATCVGNVPGQVFAIQDFPANTTGSISLTLPAGTYRVVIAPVNFDGVECPSEYCATLREQRLEPGFDTDLTLLPMHIDLRQDGDGPITTKAKFDIWNMNEVRFSGTQRCVTCWDQTLLSAYGFANHFLIENLHTQKGKARIDGIASSICSPVAVSSPLLAVAIKVLRFGAIDRIQRPAGDDLRFLSVARSAMTPVGMGVQEGRIINDLVEQPDTLTQASALAANGTFLPSEAIGVDDVTPAAGPSSLRGSISKKGSLLVWPKVELKWNARFELIQDTFLDMSNDQSEDVRVQLYFVNGDLPAAAVFAGDPPVLVERSHPGWNNVDAEIPVTADQPVYWSVLTGRPIGVQPFEVLDPGFPPGRPDMDPENLGGRVLRGFVLGWAVNRFGEEINWNHLTGDATIINYAEGTAAEYNAWAFQCVSGVDEGELCDATPGELDLDGREYEYAPDKLLMDFYASGSFALLNVVIAGG